MRLLNTCRCCDIPKFFFNEEYLTNVVITRFLYDKENVTSDITMAALNGTMLRTVKSEDHPMFTEMREFLGEHGLIQIQRNWINGDRVLETFQVNEFLYRPDEQFACAEAIGADWKTIRKYDPSALQVTPKDHCCIKRWC